MKKLNTLFALSFVFGLILWSNKALAQTVIYTQNFDANYALPDGWMASDSSWKIDSTNSSTGYTGASGLNNMDISASSARLGYDTLFSSSISTVGYSSITAIWAARNTTHFSDSGSTIAAFLWSVNGGTTWTEASYTENANNSTWAIDNAGTAIALPAGAANQASLQFAWVAKIVYTPSGTYRIDDFNVGGTSTTGIAQLNDNSVYVYTGNSAINVVSRNAVNQKLNVEVYDITGTSVSKATMNNQFMSINASNLSSGIYFVKVGDETQSSVSKVFVR